MDKDALIARYHLKPHPEGGWYAEVHRSSKSIGTPAGYPGERVALTAIYFLLCEGEFSAFHSVAGEEIWIHLAGAPLELALLDPAPRRLRLSAPGEDGEPLLVVPPDVLQAARSLGPYTLTSCLVAPGFDFKDFQMPRAAELLEAYPESAELIRSFTRPG
ncbi:MAG TPA: cupin domain-containing protein [Geomonas sp.]